MNNIQKTITMVLLNMICIGAIADLVSHDNNQVLKILELIVIILTIGLDMRWIIVVSAEQNNQPKEPCDYCNELIKSRELFYNDLFYPHGRVCDDCIEKVDDAAIEEDEKRKADRIK